MSLSLLRMSGGSSDQNQEALNAYIYFQAGYSSDEVFGLSSGEELTPRGPRAVGARWVDNAIWYRCPCQACHIVYGSFSDMNAIAVRRRSKEYTLIVDMGVRFERVYKRLSTAD